MDLYARFDLPPPPPATVFSRDHTDARARMPNFTTVDQVSKFVDGSILWRHSRGANAFLIVSTTLYITISVTLAVLILHKIYKRSWWVFRVVPRGHSKIIIPNVHNSWVIFIGPYVWILLGSFIAHIIGDARAKPVPNSGLWISVLWVPMLFAVWFQTWGLIAARSDNGSTSFDKMPGRLLNRYFPSWFGNILCLCIPMVSSMAGVLPGVIGNKLCERARHGWYDWHDKYDGMSQLTRDMVVDAQNIFHSSIHSAYYICICLTIWGIWCFVFGAAYTYASCSLISDLADHLETKAFDPPPRRPETAVHMFSAHYSKADRNERQPSQRGAVSEWLTASPAASESVFNGTSSGRRNEQHRGLIQGRMFTDQERVQDLSFSFFPPIAPSRTIVRLPTSHARRALFFFTIQSASVILACVAFLGDALFMLLQSYAAAEANRYESAVISGYTATSIITLLAGTGSFVSVTHTTFEASFSVLIFARRGYQGNSDEEQAADDFLDMA